MARLRRPHLGIGGCCGGGGGCSSLNEVKGEQEYPPYMYSPVGFSCNVCKYVAFNKDEDRWVCSNTNYQEYTGTHYLVDNNGEACVLIREEEIFTANGKPINDWVGVEFDEKHNKSMMIGNIEIARPDTWVYQEFDDKTMYENNKDLKATSPQIAKIIKPNKKYGLQKDDLVFVHYLQYNTSLIIDGVKYIPFNTIFFKINGKDDFEMANDTFLARQIVIEAPKTASGIYLSSTNDKREPLKLIITHAPRNSKIKVGSTIITEDNYHYEIDVYQEKYVKITPEWVIASLD
jgi:hypothetical protein